MGWLIDQFVPVRCCSCGTRGSALCEPCAASVTAAPELQPPPHLDAFVAIMKYEGCGIDIVTALKYRNQRDLLTRCGMSIAAAVRRQNGTDLATAPAFDVVSWVPTTSERKQKRGFDQGELLARSVAGALGLSPRHTLAKRAQPPQTGSNAENRAAVSFVINRRPPASILLVDDVRTTGASMAVAAETLREGGATYLFGATLAAVSAPTD